MPLPTPPSALIKAYRVLYVCYIRAVKKDGSHQCVFSKATLKKCDYYISQKGKCHTISI